MIPFMVYCAGVGFVAICAFIFGAAVGRLIGRSERGEDE